MARRDAGLFQGLTRRATMADVAKRAGVSQATVSLVMNGVGNTRISAATRARVLQAAEDIGYRVGRRVIGSGTLRSIVMLLDEVSTSPFAATSIIGAQDSAWQSGCVLTVVTTRNDPMLEDAALDLLLEQPTAGVIYAAIATRRVTPPDRLRTVPTVLLNCYSADAHYPSVIPGNVVGARAATEALLRAGHRRIAFINGETWMDAARDRLLGYKQALASWDIVADPRLIRSGKWLLKEAYKETRALMALHAPPTAIFCASDRMALGCYGALQEMGRRIPDDVSVAGFDDDSIARQLSPALTTIVLPHEEMGRWSVERLLSYEAGAPSDWRRPVKLECPLVERQSIAPPQL